MKKIGVVGTGIMGSGIAANYLKHGYAVFVWNRTQDKLAPLIEKGAIAVSTPKEVATQADIVLEVTANDDSSRSAWLDKNGILAGAKLNSILILNATVSVPWVDELAKKCDGKGFTFFDMPLTGSRAGAENGKLVLLVGGDENKLNALKSDLAAISEQQIYFGKAGSGIRYKLLLNMLQAIHLIGLGEVLKIAEQAGMDVKKVGDALAERPGGTTTNLAWRDYQTTPSLVNFSVQWIFKDLNYAKQFGENLSLPILDDAIAKYKQAMDKGLAGKDWTEANKLP
jgi:3-hydroxyisobutyrate dehydrogenase